LLDYPEFPDKQSFYKSMPGPLQREPVTNAAWPFEVVPVERKAGLANVRRRRRGGRDTAPKCEDEPNFHDFVSEQRSYL